MRDDTNGASITGYKSGGTSADIGFQIRANAKSYFNGGNVGIGNNDPAYKLDFASSEGITDTDSIRFGVYNGPVSGLGTSQGGGIVWIPKYTAYTKRSAGILQIAEGNYFRSGLAFYTNGTADATTDWSERVRISAIGNVGIGIAAPYSSLSVKAQAVSWGEGILIDPASTGYSGVYFRTEANQNSSYTGTWAIGKCFWANRRRDFTRC